MAEESSAGASASPPSAFAELLPRLGLGVDEVPAILAAERYSRLRQDEARARLAGLDLPDSDAGGAAAVFALGSLGRLEASPVSDLDLAFIYDGDRLASAQAEDLRARVIARLSGADAGDFDVPQKTFDQAVNLRTLTRNIGGKNDSNLSLTYRALLLTEGAWLGGAGRATKHAIFRAYADATISRGRFLTSLGNDLHRYYRTLCVDYRHKVEELDKGWGIRVLKLRHSRKLWHLANLALQCWAFDSIDDDGDRDVALGAHIGWPSLLRLAGALEHFGAPELAREPFACFDRFLAAIAQPQVREALAGLRYEQRERSPVWRELDDNADRLDAATADVVELLLRRCRRFFVRFCVL
nr:DUF294 nucleotidyltransferase-like domain-containing protein [Pseudenhygromyxa sp. WMMC2535]